MNLKGIAELYATEPFEAFDETALAFVPTTVRGRVSLVDRFQSIYNKPLRRRTLFHAPGMAIPASRTVRNTLTGAVYLLGQERTDARPDLGAYHCDTVLHLVTDTGDSTAAGLTEVRRRVPKGPSTNPGWLVEEVVAQHYADFEFRTSSREGDTVDLKVGNFVVHMPRHAQLKRNDFLVIHGRQFRVVDAFPDSGFMLSRVDEEADSRVDLVIHHGTGRVYDKTLGRYVENAVSYNVTAEVITDIDVGAWASESQSYFDVVVDHDAIGAPPVAGMQVEYLGKRRTVRRVETQQGVLQYRLRCM